MHLRKLSLFVVLALGLASCNLPGPAGPTPTPAASSTATPAPTAVAPTAVPSPTTAPLVGQVSGQLCYPSEPPLPPMTLYFEDTNSGVITTLEHTDGTDMYQVDLAPGSYVAYAWRTDYSIGGSYSQSVLCGLDVSCTDHSLVGFDVAAAGQTNDIDICDWYGPAGAVPTPPGAVMALPTATATAPPGGVSLNCDGTYQRVRIVDQGAAGKTIAVDNWVGGAWMNVWNIASGDPNLRQLTDDAGHYPFGGCQRLVVVPFRHSNPQVTFELSIHQWNGAGMVQVYSNQGYYGEWSHAGAVVTFKEASKLGTINNGPLVACEWQTLEHEWDGSAFNQVGSNLQPVANCTPTAP
jgi:hypothetical protein